MANIRLLRFFSGQEDDSWLEEGRRVFLSAFPNPDRIGCPQTDIIKRLASGSSNLPVSEREEWLAHMSCCSPCAQEYYGHVAAAKRSSQKKVILALCAAMAIIGIGIALWQGLHSNRTQKSVVSHQGSPQAPVGRGAGNPIPQPELKWEFAQLDLRPQSVTRGETPKVTLIPSLPRGRLELSILLPLASKEGLYDVRLIQGNSMSSEILEGNSNLENHNTVLMVRVDTSGFQTGDCQMAIRRKGGAWGYYNLQLK
jgi:hypothetical protein